jgi:hypothetical protein
MGAPGWWLSWAQQLLEKAPHAHQKNTQQPARKGESIQEKKREKHVRKGKKTCSTCLHGKMILGFTHKT